MPEKRITDFEDAIEAAKDYHAALETELEEAKDRIDDLEDENGVLKDRIDEYEKAESDKTD